jgi:hypothetical protein
MPHILRCDGIGQIQRCRTNQQIIKRKLDSLLFLLSFDSAGQSCDFQRHGMYWDVAHKPFDELQTPLLSGSVLRRYAPCTRSAIVTTEMRTSISP